MGEEINKDGVFEELCLHTSKNRAAKRAMPILVRLWAWHAYYGLWEFGKVIIPDISSSKQNIQVIAKNSQQINKLKPA